MRIGDIEDRGSILIIRIPDSKTAIQRTFVVDGKTTNDINVMEICRKYAALRPKNVGHQRFFVYYRAGKCTTQVVGKNTLAKVPTAIAKFLGKENVDAYTGHCLRRTSATLLADAGADILSLKRHGGWKSTSVAEGYVNDSIENKRKATNGIIRGVEPCALVADDYLNDTIEDNRKAMGSIFQEEASRIGTGFTEPYDQQLSLSVNSEKHISKDSQSTVASEFLSTAAITIMKANNCSFTINVQK